MMRAYSLEGNRIAIGLDTHSDIEHNLSELLSIRRKTAWRFIDYNGWNI